MNNGMNISNVFTGDPPGILRFDRTSADDIPQWASSDDSVVRISSTSADGTLAVIAWGMAGVAKVVVTSWSRSGIRRKGEWEFHVRSSSHVRVDPIALVFEAGDQAPGQVA